MGVLCALCFYLWLSKWFLSVRVPLFGDCFGFEILSCRFSFSQFSTAFYFLPIRRVTLWDCGFSDSLSRVISMDVLGLRIGVCEEFMVMNDTWKRKHKKEILKKKFREIEQFESGGERV